MGTERIYYYLADDPELTIFSKDVFDGVIVLPALAVCSTSYYYLFKARERALANRREFFRDMRKEIEKTVELLESMNEEGAK